MHTNIIQIARVGYLSPSVSQEFQAILMLEPPYLLYYQRMNSIICKLYGEESDACEYLTSLYVDDKWTRVDLSCCRGDKNKIIGFNLLHLGEATFFLPRLFTMYHDNDLTLDQVVTGVSDICRKSGLADEVFGDYKKLFTEVDLLNKTQLSVLDIDNEKNEAYQIVFSKSMLQDFGMRLLS